MSDHSQLPSDIDIESKPSGWRHWWDKAATPSSDDSPPPDSGEECEAEEEE
jgi:hypothetical protein